MQNPLLEPFKTPFGTPPFDQVREEHFLPALKAAIAQGKGEVEGIAADPHPPTFDNTCQALERAGGCLDAVAGLFFNLHSAESSDRLQEIAKEFSPALAEYSNDILLNEALFERIKSVHDRRHRLNLGEEEMRLVERQYRDFTRNGALLDDQQKEELRALDKELAGVKLAFGDNVLEETNRYKLVIEDEKDLAGLPAGIREAAKQGDKWVFTLDYPSYLPFMTYADNRDLRRRLFIASGSKGFKGDERDNCQHVARIAHLRHRRACLLGYESHAHFVLQERMAQNPQRVRDFLADLLDRARAAAERDIAQVSAFAGVSRLEAWDYPYWAEKLRREKFALDEEMLRPYFKLENVINGVFEVARKLYDLNFTLRKDIAVYHPDVQAFEVRDAQERHIGVFYADFFPRPGKRSGAWMTTYREQYLEGDKDMRPHISIVCNFSKPTDKRPSLLTFREVTTLFHEFGHALHALLSKCRYKSLGGTNVLWDFVELPSQLMENWAYQKECLDLFATHYETGEKIPEELVDKIKAAATFQEGLATLRQLGLANLDMAWHQGKPAVPEESPGADSLSAFEDAATESTRLLPKVEGVNVSCGFSHIFQGGYSAGYYSYKWAEVLDADAFAYFKQEGVFNRQVADKFRACVLERGNSRPPERLYRDFRGRDATPAALLERAGLSSQQQEKT